ncbi:MAG: hypothetical protein ACLQUT_10685, partial [Thermoleophilia bacterium]
ACPLSRHQPPVPAQQRLGANEERTPVFAGQHLACRREQRAVPHPIDRPLHLTAQDRDFVTEDKILEVNALGSAILGGEHAEQSTKYQVEE